MHLKPVIAMLLFTASLALHSQVGPAAKEGGWPLVVGGAFSEFSTDMFSKHMQGPTVWADWAPHRGPAFLRGFGVEAEGRDLDSGQPPGQQLRQVTAGGGPIYTWRYSRNFHPYGKFLFDYGAMDHIKDPRLPSSYTADKWVIYACGGGVEYRAWRNVWLRADYEYQFWKVEFFHSNGYLDPQGLSLGVSYDLKHIHTY